MALYFLTGGPMGGSAGQGGYPQTGAMPQGGTPGANYPRPQMGQQGQPGMQLYIQVQIASMQLFPTNVWHFQSSRDNPVDQD